MFIDFTNNGQFYPAEIARKIHKDSIITVDTETTSCFMHVMSKQIIHSVEWENVENPRDYKKIAFIYILMVNIDGCNYYTRDTDDFRRLIDIIKIRKYKSYIWIHNLSFEFQFFRNFIDFESVLARDIRKPMSAVSGSVIFRCSYMLSGMGLARLATEYNLPSRKKSGDLDYYQIRTTETELTKKELGYCESDVQILFEYIQYLLDYHHCNLFDLPLTVTGFVRKKQKEMLKEQGTLEQIKTITKRIYPRNAEFFDALHKSFWGGVTHADFTAVLTGVQNHIQSFDLTSSYPAVILRKKYPMTPFVKSNMPQKSMLNPNTAKIMYLILKNVQSKSTFCVLSKHKCTNIIKGKYSNGRIYKAEKIEIYCTDVDLQIIKDMYIVGEIICKKCWCSQYDYLPKPIVDTVMHFYQQKTTLKNVEGKEAMYLFYKGMLNSIYGSMVMYPAKPENLYYQNPKEGHEVWERELPEENETAEEYVERKLKNFYRYGKLNVYQWGVYVTAWARRVLTDGLMQVRENVIYTDTDSIKCKGENREIFAKLNETIHRENMEAAENFGYDYDVIAPKDKFGNSHELGLWDYETTYEQFKTLGCKRYVYTYRKNNVLKYGVTCAGGNIPELKKYLTEHKFFDDFNQNLVMSTAESGKNLVTYIDEREEFEVDVPDEQGHVTKTKIKNSVHIMRNTFKTSFSPEYRDFLLEMSLDNRFS